MQWLSSFLLLCISSLLCIAAKQTSPFTELESDIFQGSINNKLAAFADLNADKSTDLLYISKNKGVEILYGADEESSLKLSELQHLESTSTLSSVVPADFDGDLVTDLLLIFKLEDAVYESEICYGAKSTTHYSHCVNITQSSDEPSLIDFNGDMKPDLLIQKPDGNLTLLISQNRNFSTETDFGRSDKGTSQIGKLISPQSNAFVDLNGDLAADIVLTTEDGLRIVMNQEGDFDPGKLDCTIKWHEDMKQESLGMSAFVDVDSDSLMDILIAETKGGVTNLYIISGTELNKWLTNECKGDGVTWHTLPVSLYHDSTQWSLSLSDSWLRVGDVDNDGYFDLLVTLTHKGLTRPFILRNTACNSTCPHSSDRTFSVMWDWLSVEFNITQVAFYDLYHDGTLDIVYNAQRDGSTQLHVLQNNIAKQSCFVSVKVGSGLCTEEEDDACSKPYSNIVGPTVRFNSTHPDGSYAYGIATQLTQSTNQALQIPYIQFGLGSTPNFVDLLTVGVARKKDQASWSETWKTIVPNSHLVVVPRPPDKPEEWMMHLYVTPSHLVLITGAVILGLIGLIGIIIAILHLKEKHQDKKVKLQEAHRFHFNAM